MKVISAGIRLPYNLTDLGVVIPHAKKSTERIEWFIPQYVKATPPEVVANTYISTDPEDDFLPKLAGKYGIKTVVSDRAWITPKLQAGYKLLKTRLCARIHNDVTFFRNDWAECLIDQFNSLEHCQLIGQLHNTGDFSIKEMFGYFEDKPYFNRLKAKIEPSSHPNGDIVGTEYLHGFFMASQIYVLRDIQYSILDWEGNNRGKDDCIITFFSALHQIPIFNWQNINCYMAHQGKAGGKFNEEVKKTEFEEISRKPIFSLKKTEAI